MENVSWISPVQSPTARGNTSLYGERERG